MKRAANKKKRQEKINHILETAKEVFAKKGYEGARTDEIADFCGISKRTMYYYTGDKETLYIMVIKHLMDQIRETIDFDVFPGDDPEEDLKLFIGGVSNVASISQIHSIALRELVSGREFIPDEIPKAWDLAVKTLNKILVRGKNAGVFVDTDPLVLLNMILSFFVYWNFMMPYLHEAGVQRPSINKLGKGISERLTKEIEQYVFRIVSAK